MISALLNNHYSFYLTFFSSYAYTIGFLSSLLSILQFPSGLLLSRYYSPFIAFSSVHYIMIDVNVGWLVRFFHVLGASLFMVFISIHIIRGTWIRLKMIEQIDFSLVLDNRIGLNLIWLSGGLILGPCLCTGFFGYILNWGQMSYWGITVIINLLSIIPLFGSYIGEYPWCSSLVIVNRIFIIHFSLGFIIGCIILVHIALLHTFPSSNPLTNNNSIIIPFYALFFKDSFVKYVIPLFLAMYLFWEPDVFGNQVNLVTANPLSTPNHILPEWYFLIYYCCLRSFPNKTMGVIIVFLFILLWV